MNKKLLKLKELIIFFGVVGIILSSGFSQDVETTSQSTIPDKGVFVELPVYSGRPNPRWVLTSGEEFDRIISIVTSFNPVDDTIFNYARWNKPGYASFWITFKGIDEMPGVMHIWRDMALLYPAGKNSNGMFTKGAKELYDTLVTQAEEKGHGTFFRNYRKLGKDK